MPMRGVSGLSVVFADGAALNLVNCSNRDIQSKGMMI